MNDLLVFWSLALFLAVALAVLRDVHDDTPRGRDHHPPRSHPVDPDTVPPARRLD